MAATEFSLQVLGVGGGADAVYHRRCSSALLVLKHDQPYCLIDLGLGVTAALGDHGWSIPERLIISHNHSDHAGELPVVLRVEQAQGRQLQLFCEHGVGERLLRHRMAEHLDQVPPSSWPTGGHWKPENAQRWIRTPSLRSNYHPPPLRTLLRLCTVP